MEQKLSIVDANPEDSDLAIFDKMSQVKAHSFQVLLQILAAEPVLGGMEENMPGDKVLVEGRVELLHKKDPTRLQNPGDLLQGSLPIRHMVENAEPKDSIQALGLTRKG